MTDSKASSQFIIKALNGENIVLKSKGEQFFSYTYVADAVNAILYVLLHGENGIPYNISNKECDVHLKDFANKCAEWGGKKIVFDIPSETELKGYSMRAVLENARIRNIGWQPKYDINDAIPRTLDIISNQVVEHE